MTWKNHQRPVGRAVLAESGLGFGVRGLVTAGRGLWVRRVSKQSEYEGKHLRERKNVTEYN